MDEKNITKHKLTHERVSAYRRSWPWLAAILSGALLVVCFPPFQWSWLCWVALVPLVSAIRSSLQAPFIRPLRTVCLGYLTGIVFFWGIFYWLTTVTVLGWFLLSLGFGLYFACWAALVALAFLVVETRSTPERPANLTSRWNLAFAFLGACSWVALEWLRGWLFTGFGWNGLGVALYKDVPFLQIAEFTGVGGLSFLIAFTNLIFVVVGRRLYLEAVLKRKTSSAIARPHFEFIVTILGIVAVFYFGVHRMRSLDNSAPQPAVKLKIAAVQAGLKRRFGWSPSYQDQAFHELARYTDVASAFHPQLLIWPEGASPLGFLNEAKNYHFVMGYAQREPDLNFLLGSDLSLLDEEGDPKKGQVHDYNAAFLLTKGGTAAMQSYYKMHLVPFGEYIPFRKSFPLFAWIVGNQVPGDFSHGEAPKVLETQNPNVRLAPLICFEDTLGDLTRRFVMRQPDGKPGAQLLVNLTNDNWFQHSAGSWQHFSQSVFRTVENRRPLLRCANTGVTCFIDSLGRVRRMLGHDSQDTFSPGVLMGEFELPPITAPVTFYTLHGEIFSQVCAGVALLMLLYGMVRVCKHLTKGKEDRRVGQT